MINSKSLKEQIEKNLKTVKFLKGLLEDISKTKIKLIEDDGIDTETGEVKTEFKMGLVRELSDKYYEFANQLEKVMEKFRNASEYAPNVSTKMADFLKFGYDKMDKKDFEQLDNWATTMVVKFDDVMKELNKLYSIMAEIQGDRKDRKLIGQVLGMAGIPQSEIKPYAGKEKRKPVDYDKMDIEDVARKLEKAPKLTFDFGKRVSDYAKNLADELVKEIGSLDDLKEYANFIIDSHRMIAHSYGDFVANVWAMYNKVYKMDEIINPYRETPKDIKKESKIYEQTDPLGKLAKLDPELYDLIDYLVVY